MADEELDAGSNPQVPPNGHTVEAVQRLNIQDALLSNETSEAGFDFEGHAERATARYRSIRGRLEDFASLLEDLLDAVATASDVQVHTLESRAKKVDSFKRKAAQPSAANPHAPKYANPLEEITDLAGVRVITFFLDSVARFEEALSSELEVVEKTDKSDLLEKEERLGYHSVHYIVRLGPGRSTLPEYSRFAGLRAEVQVRTILQHAWAEIEHDVQYKAESALPTPIRRRFITLAGLLEIADREFQEIQNADARIRAEAQEAVESGDLEDVEVTADALRAYLERRYGPDDSTKEWAYEYEARQLRRIGFQDLDQLEAAIAPYDDVRLNQVLTKGRKGQIARLDAILLASLGELYIDRHQLGAYQWYRTEAESHLAELRAAGVETGQGLPLVADPPS